MKKLSLAVLCAAFVAAPALAQDSPTLKKIKDTGTITIGHRDSSIPFSYYDDKQQVVGYAMDICMKVVDAIKAELKMPNLQVKLNPVTSATRIPLIANGTIDLECGSTTNNADRQKQVGFTNTYFVTANRYVAKKSSNIKSLADLKGKTIVSTAGTTNLKWVTEENQKQNLGMNILTAKDHAEAFLMVETGRAVAFFMDDILLYSLVANSKAPADYAVGSEAYTVEPYGAMMPRDDAGFRQIVASVQFFASVPNLQKILNALETREPLVVVENITIRPANAFRGFKPAAGQEPEVNVQLETTSWAMPEAQQAAAATPVVATRR